MHWQWTRTTCWLLFLALFGETGHGIQVNAAFPVSDVPVSSQEEEETTEPATKVASHPARRLTAKSARRARFLPLHRQAIREPAVVPFSQPLCERTRHKGAGTHLRR
jgi:hypothetical protein